MAGSRIGTDTLDVLLVRHLAGEISAPMTLMHLLIETKDAALVGAAMERFAADADPIARNRLADLARFLDENRAGAVDIAALLRDGIDHVSFSSTAEARVAECRALFNRLARRQPEASVALYSLGSPALLSAFTGELAERLRAWGLVSPGRRVLDLGCGIGRVAAALAPEVAWIVGIDISPEMIAQACKRCTGLANLHFVVGSGRDLAGVPDASIDLVLAVDSFPYMVGSGNLSAAYFAETARVLVSGGDFLILNFSYRGNLDADRHEVERLGAAHRFVILRHGIRPYRLWDGTAFHLRRAP